MAEEAVFQDEGVAREGLNVFGDEGVVLRIGGADQHVLARRGQTGQPLGRVDGYPGNLREFAGAAIDKRQDFHSDVAQDRGDRAAMVVSAVEDYLLAVHNGFEAGDTGIGFRRVGDWAFILAQPVSKIGHPGTPSGVEPSP